jgi:hypothetical protein
MLLDYGASQAFATADASEGSAVQAKRDLAVNQIVQPVHEYFWPPRPETCAAAGEEAGHGPYPVYTHLGTDFGRMGPSASRIQWRYHEVGVDRADGWAGMWHSLSGSARERTSGLDFSRCYPPFIREAWQPQCAGVVIRAMGSGRLRLELRSPHEEVLWQKTQDLESACDGATVFTFTDEDIQRLRSVKLLCWVAEPGSAVRIDSVGLLIRYPAVSLDKRLLLLSYAKLARCYVENEGVVKDRAELPAGKLDCVPTSGLFCLATALASKLEIVERGFASRTLRRVHAAISTLPRAKGLLPHFIHKCNGRYRICDGAEYSTVDTALYYHGALLAARMLGDAEMERRLAREIRSIEFGRLRTPEGYVSHGLKNDGVTLLPSHWRDWGGETALVLLLERMALGEATKLRMSDSGEVYRGVGFILEIQNLFYREFDSRIPDAVTRQNWHTRRRELLARQMAYFASGRPSRVGRLGVFGLSAGEGPRGVGYVANGVEDQNVTLIHPHYMLMSATAQQDPGVIYGVFQRMERSGLLPPWGIVENVDYRSGEYLPSVGSLNASFETIAAYHLWAKANRAGDAVYDAVEQSDALSGAIRGFYPVKPAE